MAKETVYNNTLVSGAADETLTYTRYVKDESSGKSTKELLDEKVNKTDQLGTTQIADKAVTTEKLENESVTTDKLDAASVTTDKVADTNITTSKLADSSVDTEKINNKAVTTDKLNDGAVDNSKLSPNAVTSEKIKDESIITEKINNRAVTTEKVEEKAITNTKIGDSAVDGRTISEASVEKKHIANDSVTTEKLQDSAITSDKIHTDAVTEEKIKDSSVSNSKLADNSVGTSKIKDGNITNEKVANNTLTLDKLDPELRKSIQAATGLPENLVETIQDVDKEVKTLHSKDTDLQSQITDKQQQITAHDKDIELLQTRSTQMEQTINNIAATGGASVANTVAYTNTTSGLESVNAQGAIDELAAKNKTQDATISGKAEKSDVQSAVSELKEKDSALSVEIAKKANAEDVSTQMQTEQERVNAEFAKKFDKESILQESGEAEDKVMSQKAVSDKLNVAETSNFNLQCTLFASILRTNIFAAVIDNHYYDTITGKFSEGQNYSCIQLFPIKTSSFIIKLNLAAIGVMEYDADRKFLRYNNPTSDIQQNVETKVTLGEGTRYVGVYGQKNSMVYSADSFKDSYIIINDVPDKKIDKSSIVQELGEAENKVVSQKRWTLSETSNFDLQSVLFASLLRTNIFAAVIDNHYYDTITGKFSEGQNYSCIQLFPIKTSSFIIKLNLAAIGVMEYDADRKFLRYNNPTSDIQQNVETKVTLGEGTRYVGVYGQKEGLSYSPETFKDSYISINDVPNQQFGNLLYNKKWCACGDSFTIGGYNEGEAEATEYIYQDGKYKGKQIVYPYIIGLRNNMEVVNLAVGGMTMCNIDGNRANSFSNNTYKNIPLDSDYITLKFGINDGNFNSPIGTIDDENTSTFYGAWNTVIKWIFDNRPYSKIGIIISSGLGDAGTGKGGKEISDATINIAKKWGIPILDEVNDITVPLLHRTDRIGVSDYVKSELIKRYAVNSYNTHPNVKAHEFESTFVEAFLRKL